MTESVEQDSEFGYQRSEVKEFPKLNLFAKAMPQPSGQDQEKPET